MKNMPELSTIVEEIETRPMRDLVERYPNLMPLLARFGFDLCCGGGHTVPEAARLHGLEVEPLVDEVSEAIALLGQRGAERG
jgi:iron-sulfur cluster repair protein YtfE (RIC family)